MQLALGHAEIVATLLDASDRVELNEDANSCTPLMLAARGGHLKCVKMLMNKGADYSLQTVPGGWTCLMYD